MAFRPIVITVAADPAVPRFDRRGEPVSLGVACPRGAAIRADRWGLTDQLGQSVPVQTTTLDRWSDGSIRWLLVEFKADVAADTPSYYALAPQESADAPQPAITIDHAGPVLRVSTGVATIDVPRSGPAWISAAQAGDQTLLRTTAITAEDNSGARYALAIRRLTLERMGELTAAVRLDGALVGQSGESWLDAAIRLTFFAGLGTVRAEVTLTNPRAARHPGGTWDLGDAGSVLIRDLSIQVETLGDGGTDVWGSLDETGLMEPASPAFTVYQDSSGGANWQHATHANRDDRLPLTFRGFRALRGERSVEGLRATPIASIGGGASRVSVAIPRFWQMFPKSLAADGRQCTIGVFPHQSADLHELQGGERTTLTFALCFGRDTVTAEPLAWVRAPLSVSADPLSYRQAGAWSPLAAGSRLSSEGYDVLVSSAISGPDSFEQRREIVDEYGWRNFGELYADHEAVHSPTVPFASHYNNQYDAVCGFLTRFMQTGDRGWRTLGDDLAAHVADIDLYHTTRDRAAYNGGYFWHTQHYQPAGTATHRAYSRRSGSSGGGPSAEHNYTSGLMLHFFLTGSERSREAVVQLANWVIDMDDGRKSRFRWIDRRDTGLASGTRSPDFHGPGRGAGNSINALLDAHRLTLEPRYLEKAEALIARCVHPDDDPAAIDPLDAENRWSYTVFLQALGKYLEYRAERGLVDAKFEYAREVLIRYAEWMCTNERPYLDTPERLEYPTETWAAQDLRKAAVFEFAARHTRDSGARGRFLLRADSFVDYAIRALLESPTGRLTRPLVLVLAYGFQRPTADLTGAQPPALDAPFAREAFTPLRQRLAKKLAWAGAGLSAAAVLVIVLLAS